MAKGNSKVGMNNKIVTYALFHGSPSTDIEEFDMERAGTNTRSGEHFIFFTDSKDAADEFSYERQETDSMFFDKRGKKGKVYEVDVSMRKPLDLTNLSNADVKNIMKLDISGGLLTEDMIKRFSNGNNQLLKQYIDLDKLSKLGYDGFIAKLGMDKSGAKEYAVINSKQAKIKKRS